LSIADQSVVAWIAGEANLDKKDDESLLTLKIEDLSTQLFVCGGFLGCVRQQRCEVLDLLSLVDRRRVSIHKLTLRGSSGSS
jgi:hypothetical protein